MLIVNADDWGRSCEETDMALACFKRGRISSTTAMVFMADSARAAEMAGECGIDVGLHLNLSQHYTDGANAEPRAVEAQQRVVRFLKRSKYAPMFYHPFLCKDFRVIFRSQMDEFLRLYGKAPSHVDGHQHMHLCTNMLVDAVIPRGEKVRRSFTFFPGEKSRLNRAYRRMVNGRLAGKYKLTEYFFSLSQYLDAERLQRVAKLAANSTVELMTHPILPRESELLLGEKFVEVLGNVRMGNYSGLA